MKYKIMEVQRTDASEALECLAKDVSEQMAEGWLPMGAACLFFMKLPKGMVGEDYYFAAHAMAKAV